ncbi:hypothetical protein P9112_005867 [Eukaryota sp. TZLM1-RC]
MGNLCSRGHAYKATSSHNMSDVPLSNNSELSQQNSFHSGLFREHRLVKPDDPVSNHIIIEDSTKCDILICKQVEQVNVDVVKDSLLYIGPTSGSVFIRDCSDLLIVAACQQLRLANCKNIRVSLLCKTRPIIESSSNIVFYPYHGVEYKELLSQLMKADLSPFVNSWSHIHDFTPSNDNQKNYSTRFSTPNFPLPSDLLLELKPSTFSPVVPLVKGSKPTTSSFAVIVLFFCQPIMKKSGEVNKKKSVVLTDRNSLFAKFFNQLSAIDSTVICNRSAELTLSTVASAPSHIKPLFETGPIIAAEFSGVKGIAKKSKEVLTSMEEANPSRLRVSLPVWVAPGGEVSLSLLRLIFCEGK